MKKTGRVTNVIINDGCSIDLYYAAHILHNFHLVHYTKKLLYIVYMFIEV